MTAVVASGLATVEPAPGGSTATETVAAEPAVAAPITSMGAATLAAAIRSGGLRTYFVLVFAISTPFWLLGAVSGVRLTPNLSLGSLMIVAPFSAAVLLTAPEKGSSGVRSLLHRAVDVRALRGRAWYLPIFLLMPGLMVVEYGVLRLAGVPVPGLSVTINDLLVGFGLYFVAALFEEVGWSGYAIDRLQARWSALTASAILGLVWAIWHLPAMLEMPVHHTPDWIAWQFANLVLTRIVIVWIYNNTGRSVLAAVLYHAVMNLSTLVLFPVNGSYYDPFIADVLLAAVVAVVVAGWGSRTLARFRVAGGRGAGRRRALGSL